MPNRSAFTLIELLIVVAIISVLASIAVPNFLEAQVRAKVSRNRADMRTIGVALELYRLDCNHYPPDRYYYMARRVPPMDSQTADQSLWLHVLTTPVAYMTSIPDNVFANRSYNNSLGKYPSAKFYLYTGQEWKQAILQSPPLVGISDRGAIWSIFSVGPDQKANFGEWFIFGQEVGNQVTDATWNMHGALYDPTNGTVSAGDVVRFGP